jgi:hypothetical protein
MIFQKKQGLKMTEVTREQARQAYKDYRYGVSRWIGAAQAKQFFGWDKACQVALKHEKWGALVVALKELTVETNDGFAETEAENNAEGAWLTYAESRWEFDWNSPRGI